jgi:hypothetical protein
LVDQVVSEGQPPHEPHAAERVAVKFGQLIAVLKQTKKVVLLKEIT